MAPGKSLENVISEIQDQRVFKKDSVSDLKSSFNVQFRDSIDEEEEFKF